VEAPRAPLSTPLVPPEPREPIRGERGIPRRILDITVPQVSLQHIHQLVAAGVAQHVGLRLDAELGRPAARSIMRLNPGADNGAPRSSDAKGTAS
jgi:hypothetical protein